MSSAGRCQPAGVASAGGVPEAFAIRAGCGLLQQQDGGTIYIIGSGILDDCRRTPRNAAFWNLNFMNFYRAGASYTDAEHAAWLEAAQCTPVERITLPPGSGIIVVKKRASAIMIDRPIGKRSVSCPFPGGTDD